MFGPRKSLDDSRSHEASRSLAKTPSWPHLIALGVGAIVGTGIYTLTGVGAERAGPAVILAFAIAGMVCACAAPAYTALATMIPDRKSVVSGKSVSVRVDLGSSRLINKKIKNNKRIDHTASMENNIKQTQPVTNEVLI